MRNAVFNKLYDLAKKDRSVMVVVADMGAPALDKFREDFPDQFIDVGIAEQAMVSIACGLVLSGKKVFTYAIAPFATIRCYEALKVNFAMQHLPLTVIGVGGGQTYWEAGPTHHTYDDVPLMELLGARIYEPKTLIHASNITEQCYNNVSFNENINYIRLPRGNETIKSPQGCQWEKCVL